jgi:nucleoside-diphosphate-sugar epimerase
MSTVLVTGGTGFIGAHTLVQLIAEGHTVRTTVRNLARQGDVIAMLKQGGADPEAKLAFFQADLESDAGWREAVSGCDYVLHIASPFPPGLPRDENELIIPAREGALRVLRAARDAGVKRVVLTSSFAAIGYGRTALTKVLDETDWTDPEAKGIGAYVKSKAIAERAAWDFMDREGGALELSVINPVGVFGPVLGPDYSSSILAIQRLMSGALPGCPKLEFGIVDVRDVALLHIRAMTAPQSKGERFLAISGNFLSFSGIAKVLKDRMGPAAAKVPTGELPNWLLRLAALRDPAIRLILPELGKPRNATGAKAERLLNWTPISREDAIAATAQSLLDLGLIKTA